MTEAAITRAPGIPERTAGRWPQKCAGFSWIKFDQWL